MIEGGIKKMTVENGSPINYFMNLKEHIVHLNQWIGRTIRFQHVGFECLSCHKDIPIFSQGVCKKCFFETPAAGPWVMKPELSKAHLGIEDRDLEYEKALQLQPHLVYLAVSSHLKVGVTRVKQIPTRWIDQGAEKVIELVRTPNRYLAGITEVALKEKVSDKTQWRKMLTASSPEVNLRVEKEKLKQYLPREVQPYYSEQTKEYQFHFPVIHYPEKITSINLKKNPDFEKELFGIKGQYLLFTDGSVFNVRSNEGYFVQIKLS